MARSSDCRSVFPHVLGAFAILFLVLPAFGMVDFPYQTLRVEAGSWKQFNVTIENTLNEGAYFIFSYSGIPTNVIVYPTTFYLLPGERATIHVAVGGSEPGIYYYTFYLQKLEKATSPRTLWESPFVLEIVGRPREEEKEKSELKLELSKFSYLPGEKIAFYILVSGVPLPKNIVFTLKNYEGLPVFTSEELLTTTRSYFELKLPSGLPPGNYTLRVTIPGTGLTAKETITVKPLKKIETSQRVQDYLIMKKIMVYAKNTGNVAGNASVTLTFPKWKRFFTRIEGDCSEVKLPGKYSIACSAEVLPGEEKQLGVVTFDYTSLALLLLVAALAVGVVVFKKERIVVEKRIDKVYEKDGKTYVKVVLRVINPTPEPRINVVVKDKVPTIAVVSRFILNEPAIREKKDAYEELTWIFSRVDPGEERIIAYELVLSFGIIGELSLPKPEVSEET